MQPIDVMFLEDIEYIHEPAIAAKLREKLGRRLPTKYTLSRAATMETATNELRNFRLWPVDRYVYR
jgi:hypothetical protein